MKLHLPIVLRTLLLAVVIGMPSYVSAADRNYVVSGGSGTSDVVGSKGGAVYKKDGSISLSGYDSLQLTNNEATQMGGAICATHKTGEEENINGYEIYIDNPNSVSLSDINNINALE